MERGIYRTMKSLYVSPIGRDSNPGTKSEPFKSMIKTRSEVIKIKSTNEECDVLVYIRGDRYLRDRKLVF